MAANFSCVSDLQCPETYQLCYVGVSWDPRPSFCDCNYMFGWTGENCDELGQAAIAWLCIDSALLLGTILVLVNAGRIIYRALADETGRQLFVLGGGIRTLVSFILCTVFFVFAAGFLIFLLVEVTNPLEFGQLNFTYLGDLEKQGTYTPGTLAFLSIMIATFMINSLNLGVVWNELANKEYETEKYKYRLGVYKLTLAIAAFALLISTIALLVEGNYATLGIVYAAAATGLLILFAFGVSRYRHLLELSRQGDDRVDTLVARTARTFFPALVGLVASVILFVVFVFLGVKEYSPPDSVSLITLFLHIFLACGWVMQVGIYYYLRNLLILQIDTILVMTGAKEDVLETQVSYSGSAMYGKS